MTEAGGEASNGRLVFILFYFTEALDVMTVTSPQPKWLGG